MIENTTPLRSHITVTASYLLELREDAAMLAALRQAGVDNWEGYEEAQELYEEDPDIQKMCEICVDVTGFLISQ